MACIPLSNVFQCCICKKFYESNRAVSVHQRQAHPFNCDHRSNPASAQPTTAHADSSATAHADSPASASSPDPDILPCQPPDSFPMPDDSAADVEDAQDAAQAHTCNNPSRKRKQPSFAIPIKESVKSQSLIPGVPQDIQQSVLHQIIRPADAAMGLIYRACDDAGAPKYLADSIIKIIKDNDFDVTDPSITQRSAFFSRMSSLIGCKPIEEVSVILENGKKVKIFRPNFHQRLQRHLLSIAFDLASNLVSLPNPRSPWSSFQFPQVRLVAIPLFFLPLHGGI